MMTGNYDKDLYHLTDKVSAFRTSSRLRTEAFPEVVYAKATTVLWTPGDYHLTTSPMTPLIDVLRRGRCVRRDYHGRVGVALVRV